MLALPTLFAEKLEWWVRIITLVYVSVEMNQDLSLSCTNRHGVKTPGCLVSAYSVTGV